MKAEIISVGTELLLGTINDTNAQYLAQRLTSLGIDCYHISQVGDNLGRIVEVLARAWDRSDLTITTGGLGPTADDLTREAIAALLGETPTVVPNLEESLRAFFSRRDIRMPEQNLKQATVIPSADIIPNPLGTAPGWWTRGESAQGARSIVSMPGVPFEMKRMWEREVEPELLKVTRSIIVSRTLKTLGLGESTVEEMVADLMEGTNPTLAPYAKSDGVHLRITAKAEDREAATALIDEVDSRIRERLGLAVYGTDGSTPASVVADLLQSREIDVALLEVGDVARGLLAPALSPSGRLTGIFAVESLQDDGGGDLESRATMLLDQSGAALVLGLDIRQQSVGDDGTTVRFDADLCLASWSNEKTCKAVKITQSWQTARSEVGRLVTLAALNLLRRHILSG